MATLAALVTLLLWRLGSAAALPMDLHVVPLHVSVAVIVLLCTGALGAIELQQLWLARLCVAPVVVAIAATIIAWVFGLTPPFGITLFGQPGIGPSWFPPRAAIEAAIPTALASFAILALFGLFLWRGIRASVRAPDLFGFYLALGITMMVCVQAFINMSVVLGLLPTKGIPLPFLSYGGSSFVVMLAAVGILLNVSQQSS